MSPLTPTIQTSADPTVFLLPTTTIMEPGGPSLFLSSVVTLPGSIMPSDVSSLVGSSFPTTLVMDTEAPASPLSLTATATAATIIYTSTPTSIGTASSADATVPTQGSSPASNTAGSVAGSAASGHVSTTLTGGAPLDKVSVGRSRCLYEWGRAEAPGRLLLTGFRGFRLVS